MAPAVAAPGTPNRLDVYDCAPGALIDWESPRICVDFRNTATEPVRFRFRWKVNGLAVTPGHLQIVCPHILGDFACDGADNRDGFFPAADYRRGGPGREMLEIEDLAYDAEYCIQLAAVDASGTASEVWSNWGCARTPPKPPPPRQPPTPRLSYLPPAPGQPARLLASWSGDARQVWSDLDANTVYELTKGVFARADFGPGFGEADTPFTRDPSTRLELTIVAPPGWTPGVTEARVRLCKRNYIGESCSAPVSTATLDPRRELQPHGGAGPVSPYDAAGADDFRNPPARYGDPYRSAAGARAGAQSRFETPVLLEPTQGATAQAGRLRVRIAPLPSATRVRISLGYLDDPSGAVLASDWEVSADEAAAGVILPRDVTGDSYGRFRLVVSAIAPDQGPQSQGVVVRISSPTAIPPERRVRGVGANGGFVP